MSSPYPGTQSVLRAIAILKSFDDDHTEWRLTDLARSLDLNKTTVFRLLSALESEGLVARNPSGESFVLGSEIVAMGAYALRASDLHSVTRPALEQLAAATGETASLEILSGNEMVIIDEVVGEHLVSGMRSIGTRWPIHGTSTGLAILSVLPAPEREAYLCAELLPIAPRTITDHRELNELLLMFASQGYAVSDEMLESGLVAIGAAVNTYEQKVEAAVSVYGPKARLDAEHIPIVGELVCKTAEEISRRLGYRFKGRP